ncbi:MAG: hypothetical protein AB1651_18715 [Pseudomonadota bacterium]
MTNNLPKFRVIGAHKTALGHARGLLWTDVGICTAAQTTRNAQRCCQDEGPSTTSAARVASLHASGKAKRRARLVGETNAREHVFPANRLYAVSARLEGVM